MRITIILVPVLLAIAAGPGCNRGPKDAGFTAKAGLKLDVPPPDTTAKDTAQAAPDPAKVYGFSVEASGPVEVHFYDGDNRHTGPATAEEYLPVVQLALNNPNLHPQERSSLEEMKARIQTTGSAGEFAVTRRIPNLAYSVKGTETRATYAGGDDVVMRIRPTGVDQARLTITSWDHKRRKHAVYALLSGTGQAGEITVSAVMDDFTISWDGGSGSFDREIPPSGVDSQAVTAK